MQVFKIEPMASYPYGVAIVAARNSEEAIKTYCSNELKYYKYDEFGCTCNIVVGLDYETKIPILIFDKISLG